MLRAVRAGRLLSELQSCSHYHFSSLLYLLPPFHVTTLRHLISPSLSHSISPSSLSVSLSFSLSSGSNKPRVEIPSDENKLIRKKHREVPGSVLESKQCTAELTTAQLEKITYSHKVCMPVTVSSSPSISPSLYLYLSLSSSFSVSHFFSFSSIKHSHYF